MEFLKELHKNKRIKIRLCIAIFLAFLDRVALVYLAYVIITEILRFMSRKDMPFLNSIFVKIFLILFLSKFAEILSRSRENEGWAIIIAYMFIAFLIEQPFKFFIKRKIDKKRRKKYGVNLDYDFIEEENELGFKTKKSSRSQESESFNFSFTFRNDKKRKSGSATDFDFEESLNIHQSTTDQEQPFQKVQYKVSACPSCGFRNKIVLGNVESCEYCGSPID